MAQINFNEIPDALRLPFTYTEIDGSGADQGLSTNPFTVLLAGQMFVSGTAEPGRQYRITSAAAAGELFGTGSMLARMCAAYLRANSVTRMFAIGIYDNNAGSAAEGSIVFSGSVTSPAPVSLYIAGQRVQAAASISSAPSDIAEDIAAAVNANTSLPVIAVASDATVSFTARHEGELGNDIDLRLGYNGEVMPEGLSAVITPMSGGAGSPDAADIIAGMGSTRFHFIAWPWRDSASMGSIKDEMDSRWGPLRQIDGQAITVVPGNFVTAVTFSSSHNNKSLTVLPSEGSPTPSWEDAAASTAVLAYYGNIDPARPFNTLPVPGVLAPAQHDIFPDFPEKNQGLYEGLSARFVDADGNVCFKNVITTYRTNAAGAETVAFLSLNSPLTLSYLRYDWNNYLQLKYPRHKLASDESAALYGTGVPIITPSIGKAEAVARFQKWLEAGLVEGPAQFKNDLIVERDPNNENRLNWLMRPDLVNQFNIAGTQLRHLV